MVIIWKIATALSLAMLLASCGGSSVTDTALSPQQLAAVLTTEGRTVDSCVLDPVCSGNPSAPFTASTSVAPVNGAVLSGIVRIEVRGYAMANIELLPASAYTPRLGIFNITGDRTIAWLDLDTTVLPNGPLNVRVSAFNLPAGQPGAKEIIAMPARTWNIQNASRPPSGFTAAITMAPANGAAVRGVTRLEVRGSGIANAELLPATGYTPRLGVFNVSADKTMAWLDFDSRSLPDGARDVRISAYNVTEGQLNAREIIAMPTRRWNLSNGSALPPATLFTASVTIAPRHGEMVSGIVRLEVRGSGMRNVELLPASGYAPRLGVFNLSSDGTFAWLDFDTANLTNSLQDVRISAFNVPAGQPGAREIIAMPARHWNTGHAPQAFLALGATFDAPTAIAYDALTNVLYITSGNTVS